MRNPQLIFPLKIWASFPNFVELQFFRMLISSSTPTIEKRSSFWINFIEVQHTILRSWRFQSHDHRIASQWRDMFTLVITRVSQTYLSMKPTFLNETFGCTWSSLLHAGFLYLLWTRAFHCSGSSCWGAQALGARTSGVAACGPRSYPTLCNSMDCSLPGSSIHGIFQARIMEWIAIFFSRGSSQPRD